VLEPATGAIKHSRELPINLLDEFEEKISYSDSWLAIPFQFQILLVDVHAGTVKYLQYKTGHYPANFVSKLEVRSDLVLATTHTNLVPML
jgi:hypothetical protein